MVRAFVIATAVVAALQPTPTQAFKRLEVGAKMPYHTLLTPAGESRQLADTLGHGATAIVFWASWSPRSEEALEGIQELRAAQHGRGIIAVAVNVDGPGQGPGAASAIDAARSRLGPEILQLVDSDLTLYDALGIVAVPSLVLLDPAGRVAAVTSGYSRSARAEFADRAHLVLGLSDPAGQVASDPTPGYQPRGQAQRHYRMAQLYLRKHRTEKALELLGKALAEDPLYSEVRTTLASTLRRAGRPDEATRLELAAEGSEEYCLVPRRGGASTQWQ